MFCFYETLVITVKSPRQELFAEVQFINKHFVVINFSLLSCLQEIDPNLGLSNLPEDIIEDQGNTISVSDIFQKLGPYNNINSYE